MTQQITPRINTQAGMSLIELTISMGILTALLSLIFQSFADVTQNAARDSAQSYAVSRARGAMELVARSLRADLIQFNTVAGSPLGVNFDLNEPATPTGTPVVRDGILFYFDANHTAQIYKQGSSGQPQTAGFDDANGDGFADVMGLGLVPQDLNGNDVQDFIDLNRDGQPDDLDGDGNVDPLWAVTMVHFDKLADVSNATLWREGRILTTDVYIRRLVALLPNGLPGPLSGSNIVTFQFSAHNPVAMLYDFGFGGNRDDIVSENELGNMTLVGGVRDGIINDANEAASIDSVTISLNVVELASDGLGKKIVLSGDISSDLITPRALALTRRNGIVGIADPGQAVHVN
jgi:type II secretory pathway pseudopilin PulG